MQRIIGLSGEMESGKDTFAVPFVESGWLRGSFAANLKTMCGEIFGLTEYQLNTTAGKASQLDKVVEFDSDIFIKVVEWMGRTHDIAIMATQLIELRCRYIGEYKKRHGSYKTFDTPRMILRFIGTEICRAALESYHTDVLLNFINNNKDKSIIVTDSRFGNERELLKKHFDATLIRIKRPRDSSQNGILHASENSLGLDSEYDLIIVNDSSIVDLHEKAKEVLNRM